MVVLPSVLFGGAFLSPPAVLLFFIVLLVVALVGRVLLALTWRIILIALAIIFVLWLIGLLGVSLF